MIMPNKKLIYITSWDFTDAESNGVCKKIISQINSFRKAGFQVDYSCISEGKTWIIRQDGSKLLLEKNGKLSKFAAHRLIGIYLKTAAYPYAYIRYNKADIWFNKMMAVLKKEGTRSVVEIPTFPYDKECSYSLRDRAVLTVDRIHRKGLYKCIDRFASYSSDSKIYGVPVLNVVNGVDFEKMQPKDETKHIDNGVINLIGVAMFTPSHGYDRMILGLAEYYLRGGERNIIFHLVGDGALAKQYRQLIDENKLSDHVIMYGKKFGAQLDDIYDQADIGVECLANFRQMDNVTVSSALKSREYAAKGLPIICSTEIDIMPSSQCDFIMKVSDEDRPIDIDAVISFYDRVYSGIEQKKIINKIREYAKPRCSMEFAMKPIVNYLYGKDFD